MKKLMCLIVLVLVVLSYPISSMAKISNMERTDAFLHVSSEDGDSKITVSIDKNLISINLDSVADIGCESGYNTGISFKFDSEESFKVPLYCSELATNFVYSFEPYFVEKLIHHLRKYYVLRIEVPNSSKVMTFDLIGFIYLHDSNF